MLNMVVLGADGGLGELSDQELLQGLTAVVSRGRHALAELLAHLAEVEERRLHLRAAYPSLFSYCVSRLGFSEDEACRRIEVARLARRHPALFPLLASGQLSLSVAALLKPHLSEANCRELLEAVVGKTVQQAREALAEHFPQPDVPSSVRKLPERRPSSAAQSTPAQSSPAQSTPAQSTPAQSTWGASTTGEPALHPTAAPASAAATADPATTPAAASPAHPPALSLCPPRPAQRVAPLAPARYKVEFTADAELKAKLELARDLMRHANPSGDFAPILSRALELLIDDIQKRRFGALSKRAAREAGNAAAAPSEHGAPPADPAPSRSRCAPISRATRRRVAERDALRCCWQDASGKRCNSQAWLEHDHRMPRGKGGGSDEGNVRMLCRAHNRLEAERHFGRRAVEGAIARARRGRRRAGGSKAAAPNSAGESTSESQGPR